MTSDHSNPRKGETTAANAAADTPDGDRPSGGGVLDATHRTLTIGLASSVTVVAFLWLGVTTVMPVIAKELDGLDLYGWAFTGFMLANMLAAATVGQWADHAGPRQPFIASVLMFVTGCVVAALAPGWITLLIGRSAQGFGVGGVLTIVYLTVGRNYPDHLRAKMLALVASCWTIPALAGPVLLGALSDLWGWRAVFWLFVPLVIIGSLPAMPGMGGSGAGGRIDYRQLLATLGLVIGVGSLMVGLDSGTLVLMIVLVAIGLLITIPSLRLLMPPGFLIARKGLPTAILSRGLVSAGYYGSEAFFPLAMTTVFAFSTLGSGFALAVGAITWVVGAWGQAKFDARGGDRGRRHRIITGFMLLTAGLAMIAISLVTGTGAGAVLAIIGWGIGGLGMGLVYPSVTTLALSQSADEHKGATSGSLQLSETLSVAIITGLSGAFVKLGTSAEWDPTIAIAIVFVLTGMAALAGIVAGARTLDIERTQVK